MHLSNIWDYTKNNFEFERRAIYNVLKIFNEDCMFWGMFDNYSLLIFNKEHKSTSIYLQSGHKKMYLLKYLF